MSALELGTPGYETHTIRPIGNDRFALGRGKFEKRRRQSYSHANQVYWKPLGGKPHV